MGERLQQLSNYYPHAQTDYAVPAFDDAVIRLPGERFPVPPRKPLWANYCTNAESWVQSGRDDTDVLRRVLAESGTPIQSLGTILELGVASGRLIRHFADLTPLQTVWGVDIWASAIRWRQEHLSPPFRFATTTIVPHLPFPDGTFGLVYAGSVFTHLDDLTEAWFLELHRVIRKGGRLYVTINDRHSAELFDGAPTPNRGRIVERVQGEAGWQAWIQFLQRTTVYPAFQARTAQMISMGRPGICHVLWDLDYLKARIGSDWRWLSVTPEAYGNQTGVLLERV
jgi:SAM-dependent methyltransferase